MGIKNLRQIRENIVIAIRVEIEKVVAKGADFPREGARHRVTVGRALLQESERHADVVKGRIVGGIEQEFARNPEILLREIHGKTLRTKGGGTHHEGLGADDSIGQDDSQQIAVNLAFLVPAQRLSGVIQFLVGRIESALLLAVERDGIENDFTDAVAVAILNEAHI